MRILVVEDEAPIAEVIARGLERARYHVELAADGETGLRKALQRPYDLIILDLMLPRRDGWEVCRELRSRRIGTPILMLTARDAVDDRIRGIEMGADDYLPKPFHFGELLARVHALLRRDCVHKSRVIQIGDLEIDTTVGKASRAGTELPLSPRQFALLESLAAYEGRPLTVDWLSYRTSGREGATAVEEELRDLGRKLDEGHSWKLLAALGDRTYVLRGPQSAGPCV